MEQQQNWPELLERPAFTVEQGRVSWANQEALTRLVPQGQEIHSLLQTGAEEYAELGNGSLCLSLQIGDSRQEAAVRRHRDRLLHRSRPGEEHRDHRL